MRTLFSAGGGVQDIADLARQALGSERLGQECRVDVD
jgi:hypothetical protein